MAEKARKSIFPTPRNLIIYKIQRRNCQCCQATATRWCLLRPFGFSFLMMFALLLLFHFCMFDGFHLTSRLLPVRRLQTSVLSFSPWLWFTSLPKPCLWNPFNDKWNEGIGPPLGCHSALLFMLRDQSGAGGSNCKPSITSPSWLTWPPWPRPWNMTMTKRYHHQHPRFDYYEHPDHHCQIDHQSKHDHHVRHWRQIHWQITFTKVIHDIIS